MYEIAIHPCIQANAKRPSKMWAKKECSFVLVPVEAVWQRAKHILLLACGGMAPFFFVFMPIAFFQVHIVA